MRRVHEDSCHWLKAMRETFGLTDDQFTWAWMAWVCKGK